jgi:hypothetical protein
MFYDYKFLTTAAGATRGKNGTPVISSKTKYETNVLTTNNFPNPSYTHI